MDAEMEDSANDMDMRSQDDDTSAYNSAFNSTVSSPTRFSYSENSSITLTHEPNIQKGDLEKDDYDAVPNSANDIDIHSQEDDMSAYNSAYNSTYSSPTRLSVTENTRKNPGFEPDIQRGNYDATLSSATDIEIRGQVEDVSNDDGTTSSSVHLSNIENLVNNLAAEPMIQKGDHEKVNSVNYVTDTEAEAEARRREEANYTANSSSSPVQLSNSENSINALTGELKIQKGDQEKANSFNDSTDVEVDVRGRGEANSTDNSSTSPVRLSISDNLVNDIKDELDTQKEDQDKGNLVLESNDFEVRGQEEANSTDHNRFSPIRLSNSEDSSNDIKGEGDTQKQDQEKGNSVSDSTDVVLRDREEANSTDHSSFSSVPLSDSENVIKALTDETDIQKEDREIDNSVYDSTDIEVRGREEAKFTDHSSFSPVRLSDSENMINALTGESDTHKENQEKGNSVSCTGKQGEILDCVNDKEYREHSLETNTLNNQSDENVELKSKDGEKIGDVLNDQEGITVDTLSEGTGEMKTDPKDSTSGKKEERLVLFETQEPKLLVSNVAWPGKDSVLTKFVKFKSLYSVSNIFRRISRKGDAQDDSCEIDNNKDVKSIEEEHESQKAKNELKEVTLESLELKVIKGRIVLYTKLWCQSCKEARLFLRNKKLRYFEINIDVYPSRKRELEEITGSLDVPKVFFNQDLIGGLDEIKALDESGQLDEKIEYVTSEWPSSKAPLPPFSGEDDVSSSGVVDELAIIVRKMKGSIIVKDRFYKFRRVTNCFLGSEAVDFLSEDQLLEREEAIEFGRKLAKELFFRHVLEENTFEDGNHPYRFLDQDPVISQCQNIPRGIIQLKRQSLVELSNRLRFLLYAILDAYTSEDGKHIAYRTIHGSEEFARYLRIAEELQRLDLNKTPKEERLAFFINLYNLMAIHAILVWGHPEGALERRKLLNDFKYVIGGSAYSLSDIQNGILRANQRPPYTLIKPFAIADKRFKVSLPYSEPLIHFALVSGNRSDPALRCYSPKNIDMELMEAARNFVQSGALVLDSDTMTVSVTKILKWYSVDFGRNEAEVLKHAAIYLEVEKTQTLLDLLNNNQLKVVYQPYDWRLNS